MTDPYEKISYAVEDAVAIVRLNDPEKLNALSPQMGEEVLRAVRRAQGEARALYLCGAGRAFCSGANLAEGRFDVTDPNRDAGEVLDAVFNPLLLALRDSNIPIVVGVRGAAAGVGCAIALAGDIIVAGEGAYFLQAFRNVGLVPDGGSSYLLARAIGRVRAMEMMLLGERVPAAKALDWGLITRVTADDAVEETALKFAKQLAAGPFSLRLIRKQAWAALDANLEEQLMRERTMQREAGRSNDFLEGVVAFREKRKPAFKGE